MSAEPQIKLYDFASSPNCQRVKVVLAEKKLPFKTVPIDLRNGEQKKSDFVKLNPYGKVPVLTDGDAVLYESVIINEYLDEKYPQPPLMPKDPVEKAKIRILIDFGINHLSSLYQKLRQELMKDEKERNQEIIQGARSELKNLLQRFEQELGDRPYLAGDFSLLDAALIPRFLRLPEYGVLPDPSLSRLGKWLERMKERPSVKAIM